MRPFSLWCSNCIVSTFVLIILKTLILHSSFLIPNCFRHRLDSINIVVVLPFAKIKILSLHFCWDRMKKHSCGTTRLDALAPALFRAITRRPCSRSALSVAHRAVTRLPIALRSPFTRSGLCRVHSPRGSLGQVQEGLLALLQRFALLNCLHYIPGPAACQEFFCFLSILSENISARFFSICRWQRSQRRPG